MADNCIEGVGELGGGGVGESGTVHIVKDCETAFDQFQVQVAEQSVEAAVLLIEVLGSKLVFGCRPFLQGFDGDVEPVFDEAEIAVELIEQVEGFDFVIESVAFRHGGESLG